jgi:pimeloyl-ACP methyl ester carboxylesterase
MSPRLEAADHDDIFVPHTIEEHTVDLGEIRMNYATLGDPAARALLLIPAQTESWWGYEAAMKVLAERFQVFAVDLRGQGRSTWTPGRYTLDILAGDLVRFIDRVIGRPTIVAGLSSGGTIAAWLSAYAAPANVSKGRTCARETVPRLGGRVLCGDLAVVAVAAVDPGCEQLISRRSSPSPGRRCAGRHLSGRSRCRRS